MSCSKALRVHGASQAPKIQISGKMQSEILGIQKPRLLAGFLSRVSKGKNFPENPERFDFERKKERKRKKDVGEAIGKSRHLFIPPFSSLLLLLSAAPSVYSYLLSIVATSRYSAAAAAAGATGQTGDL